MVCPSACEWHERSCFKICPLALCLAKRAGGERAIPLVWCVLVQQGIHFRYWVIKFYVCNLQRFVAKGVSARFSRSLCMRVCLAAKLLLTTWRGSRKYLYLDTHLLCIVRSFAFWLKLLKSICPTTLKTNWRPQSRHCLLQAKWNRKGCYLK